MNKTFFLSNGQSKVLLLSVFMPILTKVGPTTLISAYDCFGLLIGVKLETFIFVSVVENGHVSQKERCEAPTSPGHSVYW